jgi:hypothetical protein
MNWHDPEQSLYWGSLSIALVYLHNRPRERQRSGACFLRIKVAPPDMGLTRPRASGCGGREQGNQVRNNRALTPS